MSGYAPLFSSLTTGTLCGRWPDIGLWPIILSLADKNGIVDVTHQYISTVTGLALSEVVACMERFCEADHGSRSPAEAGARLLLLEEHREWGWQIVNHALYRERARLMSKSAREVESGANRRRMKSRPPETAGDRRSTPETAADPLSNANAYSNKEKNAREAGALTLHASLPREAWEEWIAHRKEKHLSMSPRALNKQLKLLAEYTTDVQREIIDTSINAGWEGLFRPKGKAKPNGSSEWR